MGILSATGATSVEAPPSDSGEQPDLEQGDSQDSPELQNQVPEMLDGHQEPSQAQSYPSRRQKTAAAIEQAVAKHAETLKSEFQRQREADFQKISALEQQTARLMGQVEAFQRVPQQPQQPQGPRVDPDELERQAESALERGGYSEYRRLQRQAEQIRLDNALQAQRDAILKEVQQRIPPQVDPFVGGLLAQHRNVAMAGDKGSRAVEIKMNELMLQGAPQSPQTLADAFRLADQWLGNMSKPASAPSYTASASAVSGLPTARGGGGGGQAADQPQLTDAEKATVRAAFGGNVSEYMKWKNPQSWAKKW